MAIDGGRDSVNFYVLNHELAKSAEADLYSLATAQQDFLLPPSKEKGCVARSLSLNGVMLRVKLRPGREEFYPAQPRPDPRPEGWFPASPARRDLKSKQRMGQSH